MINERENKFSKIFLESWHPFFWITFLILLVYSATLFYNIVYLDDNVLVTGQYQFNQNLSNIPQAFQEDIFRTPHNDGSFYRPLERLTFIFDAQWGEQSVVFVSHFSNVLLHILAMCLFFVFLLKFNIRKVWALLFVLVFSIHPLSAQTVAFISGRNDSLLAIFIFPALIFFLYFLQNQKNKYFLGHLFFFALALLIKETATILPILCAFYVLIFIGWRKIIENYKTYLNLIIGWIGIVIFWFLVRLLVLHNFIGNSDYNIFFSIYKNLPSLIPSIGKIFLPFNLSVFPVIKDMTFSYGLITLILLGFWFFFSEKKKLKLIIFGFSWFFLFILLTLIQPINTDTNFSENRIYLPMFGFVFIILGLGIIKIPTILKEKINYELNKKKIILFIGLLIILIFSLITIYRNQYYKNGLNFWKNAAETSPSYAFNHNNLGAMEYLAGDMKNAEKEYKIALELNPTEPMAHNNLGLVYVNENKLAEAEAEYKKEIEINPNYDNVYYNLGLLYWNEKRYDEAISNWKKTLEINPNYSVAPKILQLLQSSTIK